MTIDLLDLDARWLDCHLLVFLCPHCRKVYLSCKDTPMRYEEQFALFERAFGEDWNEKVVPCRPEFAWTFIPWKHRATLTITPSIDASPSGHWHGFVTKGQIEQ